MLLGGNMEFFDSHAHLDDERFDEDREEIIEKIKNSGVTRLISTGYSLEGSKNMILFMLLVVSHQMIFHKLKKNCGKI